MQTYLRTCVSDASRKSKIKGKGMSAALERVIAEQQKEIDFLKNNLEHSGKALTKEIERLEEFYCLVSNLLNFSIADMEARKDSYLDTRNKVRLAMTKNGFCHYCETIGCSGECENDFN